MKFYPPHYLLVLSLCMLLTWYFGESSPQNLPLIIFGLGLIGLGFLLAFNSIARFIRAKTGVVPFSESTTLITEGFYKYTRNPMYVGMLLILVGWGVYLGNIASFIMLPVFILYMNRFQIMPEETFMAEKVGSAYQQYKKSVRRWL